MEKISCNVIKDLLPLYLDDVVSEDTREMVEEHLDSCESCRKEADILKQNVVLPTNRSLKYSDAQILKKLKQRFFKRKVVISLVSVLASTAVIIGLYCYANLALFLIPYDSEKFSIVEKGGKIYADYSGDNLALWRAFEPQKELTVGKEKNIVFFWVYETPWSKYINPLLNDTDKNREENGFCLGDKTEIGQVYYGGEWDYDAYFTARKPKPILPADIDSLIEESKLVWEE